MWLTKLKRLQIRFKRQGFSPVFCLKNVFNNGIFLLMNKQKSFTLIELLVVIVIIGILAGVIMISTSSSIDKASFTKAQAFSSTVQNELLLNLVSEWAFDEEESTIPTIIKDVWGNNDGVVSGNPQISTNESCIFNKCLNLDGVGDVINLGSASKYGIDERFTLNVWFNAREQKDYLTLFERGWSNLGSFDLYIGVSSIRLATKNVLDNRIDATYTTQIKLNSWHNIVATYDSTKSTQNVRLYFDGILRAQPTQSGSLNYDAVLTLGNYFNGLIDDARIYDAVISTSQIKQNYIAGLDSLLSKGSISKEAYNERINTLAYDNYE